MCAGQTLASNRFLRFPGFSPSLNHISPVALTLPTTVNIFDDLKPMSTQATLLRHPVPPLQQNPFSFWNQPQGTGAVGDGRLGEKR